MQITLGIHLGHDRAASVVRDGTLCAHIAEERLDRVKHSSASRVPFRSIDALLREWRLGISDFAAIGVTYTNYEMEAFISEIGDQLADYYQTSALPPLIPVRHHLAHALSSFHTSDFQQALLFVADGAGDPVEEGKLEAESWYFASPKGVELIGRRVQDFIVDVFDVPSLYLYPLIQESDKWLEMSLGYKYEQFTNLLGFGRQQEGTTMALAAYGRPLLDVRQYRFKTPDYSVTRADLLAAIDALRLFQGLGYTEFIRRERQNLARTIQDFIEHAILSILRSLSRKVHSRSLCLAGGVFLNCTLNQKIVTAGLFDRVYIVPAAGDDGQSIGAAFHAYNLTCGRAACSSRQLPFLGLQHSLPDIRRAIVKSGMRHEKLSDSALAKRVVSLLAAGKVVGMFRGRSEVGPRALCHRSLLADPRSRSIKDRLNRYIKRREMFRPFAPVVSAEDQNTFFELKQESRFMLLSGSVRRKYRPLLRGITHVDGSARVQALSPADDPFIHRLLKLFEKETGFPILLNTSFNRRGEPIVENAEDAIRVFIGGGIDVLVLERYLIISAQ
jgi:carbamoyltransferase